MLNVRESRGTTFELLSESELISAPVNSLIAKARKGGPTLLAAWHRDRRDRGGALRGAIQMQKHDRKAKRMIEKAGLKVHVRLKHA